MYINDVAIINDTNIKLIILIPIFLFNKVDQGYSLRLSLTHPVKKRIQAFDKYSYQLIALQEDLSGNRNALSIT